jgi:hypothetical protein
VLGRRLRKKKNAPEFTNRGAAFQQAIRSFQQAIRSFQQAIQLLQREIPSPQRDLFQSLQRDSL